MWLGKVKVVAGCYHKHIGHHSSCMEIIATVKVSSGKDDGCDTAPSSSCSSRGRMCCIVDRCKERCLFPAIVSTVERIRTVAISDLQWQGSTNAIWCGLDRYFRKITICQLLIV